MATERVWLPRSLREEAAAKTNGLCYICLENGIYKEGQQIDHKIPLIQDGSNELENLFIVCRPCHQTKTNHERRLPVKGACVHGIPYMFERRCPKCPPDHPLWTKAEKRGHVGEREVKIVNFDGEMALYERKSGRGRNRFPRK